VMADEAQCHFLRTLAQWGGIATSRQLGIFVDREQDRARQKCRRQGLVTFEGGFWRVTEKGREAGHAFR
jgi:hypothetical protein